MKNDSQYPNATNSEEAGREYQSYEFTFEDISGTKIRVIGLSGRDTHFTACSE